MADDAPFLPGLSPVAGKPVQVTFDAGRLTSDGGVLVLAEIERRLGLAERLAGCVEDPRAPERVQHGLAEMIRFRALLIAAGYEDANDCDALRADPAFKMAVGRLPESAADLCSQPTISRLENLPGPIALKRMMAAMIELFCDSFDDVPRRLSARPTALRCSTSTISRQGPRPAAALAVPRALRQPLLPAEQHLRGEHRQAGCGDPEAGQDAGRRRGRPGAAPCRQGHPRPLAARRDPGAQ